MGDEGATNGHKNVVAEDGVSSEDERERVVEAEKLLKLRWSLLCVSRTG